MLTKFVAITLSSLFVAHAAQAAAPIKTDNLLFADKAKKSDKEREERSKASDAEHENEEGMED